MKEYRETKIKTDKGIITVQEYNYENKGMPVVLVHGGPCGSMNIMQYDFSKLMSDAYLVSYSQMNSPESEPISREDSSYWTLDYYTDEIGVVLDALKIEKCMLAGYSWGSALAINYAFKNMDKVTGMLLLSPLVDSKSFTESAEVCLTEIVDNISDDDLMFAASLKEQYRDDYPFDNVLHALTEMFFLKKHYFPDLDKKKMSVLMYILLEGKHLEEEGQEVYKYLWGKSEFECTGKLKDMDLREELKAIGEVIPIGVIGGSKDVLTPELIGEYIEICKGSGMIVEDGTHRWIWDISCCDCIKVRKFIDSIYKKALARYNKVK